MFDFLRKKKKEIIVPKISYDNLLREIFLFKKDGFMLVTSFYGSCYDSNKNIGNPEEVFNKLKSQWLTMFNLISNVEIINADEAKIVLEIKRLLGITIEVEWSREKKIILSEMVSENWKTILKNVDKLKDCVENRENYTE